MDTSDELIFEYLPEYRLAICTECRYAVWPSQIEGHLRGKYHRLQSKRAQDITDKVCSWWNLIPFASELEVPTSIKEPIPQLTLYRDGLMCRVDPQKCSYICRTKETMRIHWRTKHEWSVSDKRGGSGKAKREKAERQFQAAVKHIACQQFFPNLDCSQYFEVRQPEDVGNGQDQQDQQQATLGVWQQIQLEAQKRLEKAKAERHLKIQEDEVRDANLWLMRTEWAKYLKELDRNELLNSIKEPDKQRDKIAAVVWEAMEDMARICQQSVLLEASHAIRIEAIRTEPVRTGHHPLQAYMDDAALTDAIRYWQQMLMFFVRTQVEHSWRSPKYRLTPRQKSAFNELLIKAEQEANGHVNDEERDEEEEEDDEEDKEEEDEEEDGNPPKRKPLTRLQMACLNFCFMLLNQKMINQEYDCALVCALAILGVTENGWKNALLYTPILSGVIKISRFIVVQKSFEVVTGLGSDNDSASDHGAWEDYDSGYESQEGLLSLDRRPKRRLEVMTEMMNCFMVRGTHSPMQWMLDLRAYGMKIVFSSTAPGYVAWNGREELLYKSIQFTMSQFRAMVDGLVTKGRNLLDGILFCGDEFGGEQSPAVPWQSIRDNPVNELPGFNFLHDQRTKMPVDGKEWLFDRIDRDSSIQQRFLQSNSRTGLNKKAVEQWIGRVNRFLEILLVLMHITGGQPARGPEILGIRHTNTQEAHRNVFIEDGLVVFITKYHKGFNHTGNKKIIQRYLPREVGELVVRYLWLVLPFQQHLEALVWDKGVGKEHMWSQSVYGKQWTSERMRHILQETTAAGLGCELGIQAYREVAIGISRRFLRSKTAFQEDGGTDEESLNESDPEKLASTISDLQAGHSSHVAGLVYARLMMEQTGVVAEMRELFRASSKDWHEFLGFGGSQNEQVLGKRKANPFQTEMEDERIRRWKRTRKMDAHKILQDMLGQRVEFRSVQERAIKAIQSGVSPVVVVMPTGAGKSMLFMLPAFAEPGGMTVVVVPLRSLRQDMLRRCRKLGIQCAEWQSLQPPDGASIVLVTPEGVLSNEFGNFLNRMKLTRRLDRVVIDECHVMYNQGLAFRKQLQQMGELMSTEAQIVLISATLPPSREVELWQKMGWDMAPEVIRDQTVRRNIRYRIENVSIKRAGGREIDLKATLKQEREILKAMVDGVLNQKSGKVIIYCNSKSRAEQLVAAGLFVSEVYHSEVSEVKKAAVMRDLQNRDLRVVVATGALGMGVDIPDIRLVIHADEPIELMEYQQESGRAGRDGLVSEAVIIKGGIGGRCGREGVRDELIKRYLQGNEECRRVVIGEHFDGDFERQQCEDGEEICDVCKIQRAKVQQEEVRYQQGEELEQRQQQQQQQQEEEEEEEEEEDEEEEEEDEEEEDEEENEEEDEEEPEQLQDQDQEEQEKQEQEEFRRQERARRVAKEQFLSRKKELGKISERIWDALDWWFNKCVVCIGVGKAWDHGLDRCEDRLGKKAWTEAKKMIESIRYDKYTGCFRCGVPQSICQRFESNGKRGYVIKKDAGVECQFYGVVFGVICGIKVGQSEIWRKWVERMRSESIEVAIGREMSLEALKYLGNRVEIGRLESNKLMIEFLWMAEEIRDKI